MPPVEGRTGYNRRCNIDDESLEPVNITAMRDTKNEYQFRVVVDQIKDPIAIPQALKFGNPMGSRLNFQTQKDRLYPMSHR